MSSTSALMAKVNDISCPKFSVIIPTFDAEKTLAESIESVVSQTYSNYEIIVIDGGSRDGTLSIVGKYAQFISVLVSEPDDGVYDAMNKGIKSATGSWVYFLGADDRLLNGLVLEKVAAAIAKTPVDFLYGNVVVNGECSWAVDKSVYDGEFSVSKLFSKNICHQAIFYSRQLFDRLGLFDTRYAVCADWDFNHKCFASGKAEFINETIAVFAAGGKSSQAHRDKFLEECVINLRKYYKVHYFSSHFSSHGKIFLLNANRFFKTRQYFRSLYFFAAAMFHSNDRVFCIKKYAWTILNTIAARKPGISFFEL